jgi:hypoxanthine phosphoribosyltransferase
MATLGKHPREIDSEMSSSKCSDMENNGERLDPVFIQDDSNISLDHYFVPTHYKDTLDFLLVPHGTILSRIDKLAMDIIQDYKGQTIYLLCVLKGNFHLTTFTEFIESRFHFDDGGEFVYFLYHTVYILY